MVTLSTAVAPITTKGTSVFFVGSGETTGNTTNWHTHRQVLPMCVCTPNKIVHTRTCRFLPFVCKPLSTSIPFLIHTAFCISVLHIRILMMLPIVSMNHCPTYMYRLCFVLLWTALMQQSLKESAAQCVHPLCLQNVL